MKIHAKKVKIAQPGSEGKTLPPESEQPPRQKPSLRKRIMILTAAGLICVTSGMWLGWYWAGRNVVLVSSNGIRHKADCKFAPTRELRDCEICGGTTKK